MHPIPLKTLNARFLRRINERQRAHVDTLYEAQGIMFLCPKCYTVNGGAVGTHTVVCWFADRGVPTDETPGPGRWTPLGSSLDDLTFVGPAAASVNLAGGCDWHGFVQDGKAS